MVISFRNTYRDIIAFNYHHVFRSRLFLLLIIFILVIGTKPNWEQVIDHAADDSLFFKITFFTILELVPAIFAVLFVALVLLVANLSKMNKTVLTDCVLKLEDDAIYSETKYARSEVKWNAIQKLVRTKSHIFMYVMQHGAVVIPRRAFNTDEAWDRFWTICQSRTHSA